MNENILSNFLESNKWEQLFLEIVFVSLLKIKIRIQTHENKNTEAVRLKQDNAQKEHNQPPVSAQEITQKIIHGLPSEIKPAQKTRQKAEQNNQGDKEQS